MEAKKVDTKEFELPETVFVRDIEGKVLQGIILECLSKITGISPIEGSFLDNILGRGESIKGIHADQDQKSHTINVKVEVNVAYGLSMPEKAEEIQAKVAEELTRMTGLHVGLVHVIFKDLISPQGPKKQIMKPADTTLPHASIQEQEYSDIF